MTFVYYEDGYCGNGDHGLEEVDNIQAALTFIEKRLAEDPTRKLEMYKIIEGRTVEFRGVETVTRLVVKQ